MSKLRKFSFVEFADVRNKFILREVLNSSLLAGFYHQNFFELVDLDEISINDFVFVIGRGLFSVEKKKV